MKGFIAGHQVVTPFDLVELTLGFGELPIGLDRELFLGVPGESRDERAAREDVAREVLRELREHAADDPVSAWDALYAEALMRTVPLLRNADRPGHAPQRGEAA
jgi:hypothetical protein